MIFMTVFSAIITLALWIPATTNAPIIAFSALYGFASGAFISLTPAIIAHISKVEEIGSRMGTFFAIVSFATLAGNPIGGALVPNPMTSPFWKLQLFAGVLMAAGSAIFIAARIYVGGYKLMEKV
jgi:MFS family permease